MTTADDDMRREAQRLVAAMGGTVTWPDGLQPPLERLRAAALTTDQIKALPPQRWVIDRVLPADALVEVYGKPGSLKSFLAAAWSLSVANGVPWEGRQVSAGPVVYVVAEGVTGMGDRITAWEKHNADRLTGRTHPVLWLPMAVQLGNAEWGAAIGDYTAEVGAELVLFDTRARNTVGLEENSARDMGFVVANLDLARERCHACMLLIHHSNVAGERPRGSSAVEGAADTEVSVKVTDGIVTVHLHKQRNGPDDTEWKFRPLPVAESIVLDPFAGASAATVTDAGLAMMDTLRAIYVGEPVSYTRWLEACDVSKPTFSRQVKQLLERGFIDKQKRGNRVEYWPAGEAVDE